HARDVPSGFFFFFSSRRRHTRSYGDWSSDVCSSDLKAVDPVPLRDPARRKAPPWRGGAPTGEFGRCRARPPRAGSPARLHPPKRSEERRVGKECRSGWGSEQCTERTWELE